MLTVGGPIFWQWAVEYVGSRRSNMLTVGSPIC